MDAVSVTTLLADLTGDAHDDVPLDRGALLIAAAFDPAVDVEAELALLDALAHGASNRISGDLDALHSINELNEYLFDHVGFTGNESDYYDPLNSFLPQVLRRRLGIPISLSLIYKEVGRRLGIPLLAIGMPGHFIVRHRDEPSLFIDPFYRGVLLSEAECAERVRKISPSVRWDRAFLSPISNRAFLARMLRNLSAIWVNRGETDEAVVALSLLIAVQPEELGHLRDRGMLRYNRGEHAPALEDLARYLESAIGAPDAWYVRRIVEKIRAEE